MRFSNFVRSLVPGASGDSLWLVLLGDLLDRRPPRGRGAHVSEGRVLDERVDLFREFREAIRVPARAVPRRGQADGEDAAEVDRGRAVDLRARGRSAVARPDPRLRLPPGCARRADTSRRAPTRSPRRRGPRTSRTRRGRSRRRRGPAASKTCCCRCPMPSYSGTSFRSLSPAGAGRRRRKTSRGAPPRSPRRIAVPTRSQRSSPSRRMGTGRGPRRRAAKYRRRWPAGDESAATCARRRGWDVDIPQTHRGDAAAGTWIVRGPLRPTLCSARLQRS